MVQFPPIVPPPDGKTARRQRNNGPWRRCTSWHSHFTLYTFAHLLDAKCRLNAGQSPAEGRRQRPQRVKLQGNLVRIHSLSECFDVGAPQLICRNQTLVTLKPAIERKKKKKATHGTAFGPCPSKGRPEDSQP